MKLVLYRTPLVLVILYVNGLRVEAVEQRNAAVVQRALARANESRALIALSEVAFGQHHYVDAVKLAIAAWPRSPGSDRPKLRATVRALGQAQRWQRETTSPLRHGGGVLGAAFSGDGSRVLTWSSDGTARLWDAATGEQVAPPLRHGGGVEGATLSRDGSRVLTWSRSDAARLWDTSRLPHGHLIDIACRMLPDHDTSEFKDRYGITIDEPICGPETPAPRPGRHRYGPGPPPRRYRGPPSPHPHRRQAA